TRQGVRRPTPPAGAGAEGTLFCPLGSTACAGDGVSETGLGRQPQRVWYARERRRSRQERLGKADLQNSGAREHHTFHLTAYRALRGSIGTVEVPANVAARAGKACATSFTRSRRWRLAPIEIERKQRKGLDPE